MGVFSEIGYAITRYSLVHIRIKIVHILLGLALALLMRPVVAKDSLETVMARMKPTQAVSIHYQETRVLGMLSDTWKGKGTFYALLPDIMLKEQTSPEKEIMGIKAAQLYYYNIGQNQKHQAELDDDEAMGFQVAAFKGLMNGDLAFLKSRYQLEFKTTPTGWLLTLSPRVTEGESAAAQVMMRGLPEQVANKLELVLADGDRTEYTLIPAAQGAPVKAKVQELLMLLDAK